VAVGVGLFLESTTTRTWRPLQIAAPPRAALAALERPPARRALSGRVVDADGEPLEEALVVLTVGEAVRWTYTDSDGGFRLDGVRSGDWSVSVVARDHAPTTVVLRTNEPEVFRELRLGERRPAPPALPSVARSPLRGSVASRFEDALEGLEVELLPTLPLHEFGGPLPRRVAVDADGSFEVPDLAAGEYRVQVLPAWARGGSWPDLARPLGTPLERVHVLRAGGDGTVEIVLAHGAVGGVLTDDDGLALEGALVLVAPEGEATRLWPPATTAEDGSFEVRDLPAGSYRIHARAGAALVERSVTVAAGEVLAVDFAPLATRE
jgi:hypothetical protein